MAKKELFNNFILAYLFRKVGAYPVDRVRNDYGAVKKSYHLLNDGQVLGMFPEGSRSKDGQFKKPHNGAALIAIKSGMPVVPVAVAGPYRFFKPLHIYIGKPFILPPLVYNNRQDRKFKLEEMSGDIMAKIKQLLPEDSMN